MMRINNILLLASALLLLSSCSNTRIMDRYDEETLSRQEDQFNLYARPEAPKTRSVPQGDGKSDGKEYSGSWFEYLFSWGYRGKSVFYTYDPVKKLSPLDLKDPEAEESYSIISICWADKAPVLRFWQRMFNSKAVEFTCPMDSFNMRPLPETEKGFKDYDVLLTLRQGTIMPWVMMDDYEIYIVRIRNRTADSSWSILDVKQLTDNRFDDIQPVYSPDFNSIAYVSVIEDAPELRMMDADGKEKPSTLSEKSSMPFFLYPSNNIIFVKDMDGFRDFRIWEADSRKERAATEKELVSALQLMPYSSLKSRYMLIGNFRSSESQNKALLKKMTFKQMLYDGLRGSPAVLRDYYEYESAISQTAEHLYDQGPDLFFASYYSAKNYVFVQKPTNPINVGDHIALENFLRLISGLSVPIIPNVSLTLSEHAMDKAQAEALRRRFYKTVNEFISDFTSAYYDCIQWELSLEYYKKIVDLCEQRVKVYQKQADLGYALRERVLFAETQLLAAKADLNNAVENCIAAQFKLNALIGQNSNRGIALEYPDADSFLKAVEVPSMEWFQAQAQVNHPDIQRADFMAQYSAAIRDMGPPSTRSPGLSVSVSYGFGIWKWSEALDDFILLSANYVMPLRLPILGRAYYDNWTSMIKSWRQEKYRAQGQVKTDVHEAYKNLEILKMQTLTAIKRNDFLSERLRIAAIYNKLGPLELQEDKPSELHGDIADLLESRILQQKGKARILEMRCEYFRRMTKLYSSGGIALKALDTLIKVNETKNVSKAYANGLYLWKSIETVTNSVERKKFLEFCSEKGINKVYCFISRTKQKELYLEKYDLEFAYFLNLCKKRNIKVYALMGEPDWIKGYYRKEIKTLISSLKKFNQTRKAAGDADFVGLKLDVEPHAFADWKNPEARQKLCDEYVSMLKYVSEMVGRSDLSVDVPYTYDGVMLAEKNEDLLKAVSSYAGDITIMAYLNSEKLIKKKVIPILERKDLNSKIEVAVETAPSKEKIISFAGSSYRHLMDVCSKCRKSFSEYPDFSGFVYHDYTHFKMLKKD